MPGDELTNAELLRRLRTQLQPTVLAEAQLGLVADVQPNLEQCHIALLTSERHRAQYLVLLEGVQRRRRAATCIQQWWRALQA